LEEPVADLSDLCGAALDAAEASEQVEAFAQETRRTEVKVRGGLVEGLEFSESRGVGVRVVRDGRQGYAWVADPAPEEMAGAVATARENAGFGTTDEHNGLPADVASAEPLEGLFRDSLAEATTETKVALAADLERAAISTDPSVRKVEESQYGDALTRVAIASTQGVAGEYSRTDCWLVVATLAERDDETQTGFAFRIGRSPEELDLEACGAEAAERAARLLGATKPESARIPVVLDPQTATSFLGVLAGALTAEAVQKGRSLFAGSEGTQVGSDAVSLIDDGRLLDGPGAAPFDDEGVPTGRTPLIEGGMLRGFLHNTYTARRGGTASTGNASRGSYKGTPGVAPSNLYLAAGDLDVSEVLARAEGGVLIQDVSGIHSGTNPISGEFSVGATGLRIRGGEPAEPLREMTIASTIPEMLKAVSACGNDLRFFSSVGAPTVLIGEMTVAGL
jgi:PmbA protein